MGGGFLCGGNPYGLNLPAGDLGKNSGPKWDPAEAAAAAAAADAATRPSLVRPKGRCWKSCGPSSDSWLLRKEEAAAWSSVDCRCADARWLRSRCEPDRYCKGRAWAGCACTGLKEAGVGGAEVPGSIALTGNDSGVGLELLLLLLLLLLVVVLVVVVVDDARTAAVAVGGGGGCRCGGCCCCSGGGGGRVRGHAPARRGHASWTPILPAAEAPPVGPSSRLRLTVAGPFPVASRQ